MCKLFLTLFLFLCSPALLQGNAEIKHSVLVSIAPYKFLVEQIAEDTCDVFSIVTNNHDPHTYEPPPRHMEKLLQAQLWFRMGETFEKACAVNLSCPQVDLTQGIQVIPSYTGCSHNFQSFDTHTWLSPKNLKVQVTTIVQALSTHFPDHAALYRSNGDKLLAALTTLDEEIQQITLQAKQRHILVTHGAFAYFCRDYNFFQHVLGKNPHTEPSPKDIVRAAQNIRQYGISSIILLRHGEKRSSALLAERFKVNRILIDPYEENVINNLKTIAITFTNL
ncbi:Putative metal ABC transporter substrate-binding protein Hpf [Chlamydia avium]|uniref:Periplasmic solute binding family protein n=2 Tax=Chlamydia avium TaxID=1457141 RepID=A0ABN0MT72_9CHLA|nr:zinc ABC transporter substrate-binding protein [Chlamydia avium]AHK62909.1 putative periplasmic metal-binding protein [Chlamydia avium 10DC88]EPP37761.1 periplasmic solute binding family protein [Chlamydia psittaci 10_743_SC13]EPP38643.1 periplasmic solute binding family protein [Chlamydia avium]VVT42528.1 Putative metal ABC transporter substrate-binding protein Hpf [Chlamydia avium]